MLNEKGERALVYITTLDGIEPIPGYDRVEHGKVGGWRCIINKADNMKVGDKVVYFEVDSKVPESDERFAFLEKRHYKVKTLKMCKVLSQGLIMPLNAFPELADLEVGTDVTEILKVTYAEAEDNKRKKLDPNAKYKSMASRHPNIFKRKWARWMMRREWGKKVMFFFFGKKKDKPRGFPSFISKTDEERIENVPWRLTEDRVWLVTEKLDGTSCTYALQRHRKNFGKDKFEFYVCSRNVRQQDENQQTYHDHNIYWDLAFKYNIEHYLTEHMLKNPDLDWVCIQGEGVGSVQGNPLKLDEDDLYIFNFKDSVNGRFPSTDGKDIVESWGMKWVPIIGLQKLPETMEEMKAQADGTSIVNPKVMREGFVYRSLDGKESFKNVSNTFLLSKH
jgi:hypothetical protein